MNEDWYEKLHLKASNLDFLCSPTYKRSLDLLCKLDTLPAIKIASPQVQGILLIIIRLLSLSGEILKAIKICEINIIKT